jgi:hypothetical protein
MEEPEMAPKLPERQLRINTQFNDELADLKTQMLGVTQAVGSLVKMVDGLIEKMLINKLIPRGDPQVEQYFSEIGEVLRLGVKLTPPADPNEPVFQVKCPNCQAVIKGERDKPVERCEWCGHVFQQV